MKKEIKAQNPDLTNNIVDMLCYIDPTPTNKYLPLLVKIYKKASENFVERFDDSFFLNHTNLSLEEIQSFTTLKKKALFEVIELLVDESFIGPGNNSIHALLKRFDGLLEKNRIADKDISSYQTIREIEYALENAEITDEQRKREKIVKCLYENEEWLVIVPLTWESSRKYGANTKWCTTSIDKEVFFRYCVLGDLCYIINKINHKKFAMHASKNREYNWLVFYDERDDQLDSIQIQLPKEITEVLLSYITRYHSTIEYLVSTKDNLLSYYAEMFEKYSLYDKIAIDENIKTLLKGLK